MSISELYTGITVNCHNDLIQTPLGGFTPIEQDLFWTLCAKMKNQHGESMVFDFVYLKDLMETHNISDKKFTEMIYSMYDKLSELKSVFAYKRGQEVQSGFFLFQEFNINQSRKILVVRVGDEYQYLLNDLRGSFTRFLLGDFVEIRRNRYVKALFVQLKRYRLSGVWNVSVEAFRELIDIPASYTMGSIQKRVLIPALELLAIDFPNLRIRKRYSDDGQGRKVLGLEFCFEADVRLKSGEWSADPDYRKATTE